MLGGASESVPTVRTPGVMRFSREVSIRSSGTTFGVVYRSSAPAAAVSRLVGAAVALPTPGGEHRSRGAGAVPDEHDATATARTTASSSAAAVRALDFTAPEVSMMRSVDRGGLRDADQRGW